MDELKIKVDVRIKQADLSWNTNLEDARNQLEYAAESISQYLCSQGKHDVRCYNYDRRDEYDACKYCHTRIKQ